LKEGVRSIIIAAPAKTDYTQEFLNHIKAHHSWLLQGANKATFSPITGSVSTTTQVAALTKTTLFKQLIQETASQETENLLKILEKRLNTADNLVLFSLEETENLIEILEKRLNTSDQDKVVLYSLMEIEDLILGPQKPTRPEPEYLMLTDEYLSYSHEKNRIHRLLQIARNRNVKTRIVDDESPAGIRISQLGGIVCLTKHE
jgi:stalled ribosome rescue protein Dom34